MKEETVFIKVPVSDKPKNIYGELIVFGKNGIEIWDDYNSDDDSQIEDLQRLYTHWLKEGPPLSQAKEFSSNINALQGVIEWIEAWQNYFIEEQKKCVVNSEQWNLFLGLIERHQAFKSKISSTCAPSPLKRVEQCKDEVARKYGYKDWEEYFRRWVSGFGGSNEKYNELIDEAMQFYANQFKR